MKKLVLSLIPLLICSGCFQKEEEPVQDEEVQENMEETELEEEQEEPEPVEPEETEPRSDLDYSFETREIHFSVDGQLIYASLLVPLSEAQTVPLVISSHGLGGSYLSTLDYGKKLVTKGYAFLSFDFRGSLFSDGNPLEQSVMSEVIDLQAILDEVQNWDFINKIILFGQSQGGLVSSIVAARNPDTVDALILNYPAFNIPSMVHSLFDALDEVPEEFSFEWFQAGYPYVADIWEYNPFDEIGQYPGPVLILHGTSDPIVPYLWSRQAESIFPDAELILLKGAGHGFSGVYFDESLDDILQFLQKVS